MMYREAIPILVRDDGQRVTLKIHAKRVHRAAEAVDPNYLVESFSADHKLQGFV
jgi:hypothetical protein